MTPEEEEKIIQAFKDPSQKERAFGTLLSAFQQKVYWHIRKIVISHDDADDATQNTFIKVWNHLSGFKENARLYTWIYRIATNEALNVLNKKKAALQTDWETVESQLADSLEDDPYFNGDSLQRKFQEFLLTLPERQRLVFNMKYFDQMKYEDISDILGTSVGALKASYFHAVRKIERYFRED